MHTHTIAKYTVEPVQTEHCVIRSPVYTEVFPWSRFFSVIIWFFNLYNPKNLPTLKTELKCWSHQPD